MEVTIILISADFLIKIMKNIQSWHQQEDKGIISVYIHAIAKMFLLVVSFSCNK